MVAMVHQWDFFAFSGVKFKENMCIDSVLAVIMHSAMVAMVHQWELFCLFENYGVKFQEKVVLF